MIALDDVECLIVPRAWFQELTTRHPRLKIGLQHELMREVAARLRQANVEISALHRA